MKVWSTEGCLQFKAERQNLFLFGGERKNPHQQLLCSKLFGCEDGNRNIKTAFECMAALLLRFISSHLPHPSPRTFYQLLKATERRRFTTRCRAAASHPHRSSLHFIKAVIISLLCTGLFFFLVVHHWWRWFSFSKLDCLFILFEFQERNMDAQKWQWKVCRTKHKQAEKNFISFP